MLILFRFFLEIIRILICMAIFLVVTGPVVTLFFPEQAPGEGIFLGARRLVSPPARLLPQSAAAI
ncbi:hypothetical protein [Brevibacillus sp. CF112]|uniref:hypothetical protein n=1 Tax=Brevibacillus TaxID=55080 RepID=UPI0002D9DF2A|nr:hypothetical protein [Brevibacillus sp. CF112]